MASMATVEDGNTPSDAAARSSAVDGGPATFRRRTLHRLAIAGLLALAVDGWGATDGPSLALPWPVALENRAAALNVISPTELEMAAPANTDLFISPDGKHRANASPRLLFRPEGPFVLTAKVRPDFKTRWDAGVLMLFNDPEHFVKFCFEQDFQGTPRIVSVVCNGVADDCNSAPVTGGEVWLRVVGSVPGDTFALYSSGDGKKWFPIRTFRMQRTDTLRVGFSAQSPAGPGCTVRFSDISLERRAPRDFWTGD